MVSIGNDKILLRFDQGDFLLHEMDWIWNYFFHFFLDDDRIDQTTSD